jgi:hypothetical protein
MPASLRGTVLVVAFVVAACASPSISNAPASAVPTQVAVRPSPVSSAPTASALPSPIPTATPAPTPEPTPHWGRAELVGGSDCISLAAAIDERSTYHLVAVCHDEIRYWVRDGANWSSQAFSPPAHRLDLEPQLAFDGNTLYLAFSRIALEEGGCGDDGSRGVGVYYRQRTLPDGAWSSARRLDGNDERLQSFRVSGGDLQATVTDVASGDTFYVTSDGRTSNRYPIPGGAASLRIGGDGKARIAYDSGRGIGYGVFNGSSFSTSAIANTSRATWPLLVLDGQNNAHVVYTVTEHGGGCAEAGPQPEDGTYYATNESGRWASTRISRSMGETSLTVDTRTGQVHVLLSADRGLRYLTISGGRWTERRLTTRNVLNPVIRLDPATGNLLVAYVGGNNAVYVLTRS